MRYTDLWIQMLGGLGLLCLIIYDIRISKAAGAFERRWRKGRIAATALLVGLLTVNIVLFITSNGWSSYFWPSTLFISTCCVITITSLAVNASKVGGRPPHNR